MPIALLIEVARHINTLAGSLYSIYIAKEAHKETL